jgi:hypothetical protein
MQRDKNTAKSLLIVLKLLPQDHLKVESTLKNSLLLQEWLQQGDMQTLGEDDWGNPPRNGHISLELEDTVGHGNPLGQNMVQSLDPLGIMDLRQEEPN